MPIQNNSQKTGHPPCLELADRVIDEAVANPVAQEIAKDVVHRHPSAVAYGHPAARAALGALTEGATEGFYRAADAFCEGALNEGEKGKAGKAN